MVLSILSCKKVYVKNCSTKGASGKCWRKLTRGGKPNADHCWRRGVQEPLILADVTCEQPLNNTMASDEMMICWIDGWGKFWCLAMSPQVGLWFRRVRGGGFCDGRGKAELSPACHFPPRAIAQLSHSMVDGHTANREPPPVFMTSKL